MKLKLELRDVYIEEILIYIKVDWKYQMSGSINEILFLYNQMSKFKFLVYN